MKRTGTREEAMRLFDEGYIQPLRKIITTPVLTLQERLEALYPKWYDKALGANPVPAHCRAGQQHPYRQGRTAALLPGGLELRTATRSQARCVITWGRPRSTPTQYHGFCEQVRLA